MGVVSAMSSGADGQLPLALHVRKPVSGKQHQVRRTPKRPEEKASEPSMMTARKKDIKKKTPNLIGQRR